MLRSSARLSPWLTEIVIAVWWHDGGREFASRPDSSPFSVSVTRGNGTLEGTFECLGVPPHTGTGDRLDVRAGSFRCNF